MDNGQCKVKTRFSLPWRLVFERLPGLTFDPKIMELWHSFVGGEPRYYVRWEGLNAEAWFGELHSVAVET